MTYRRLLSPAFSLTAMLALSACANFNFGLDEPAAPARPAASAAKPATAAVAAPPPARPAAKPPVELNALRPAPRPAPGGDSIATPLNGPPKLVGLSEDETAALLGRPAEETAQPPGKVWLYRAAGCQLAVHFFPDMEKGGFYALDYAAEGGRDACLGKVAGEARKRGGAVTDQAAAKAG